MLYAACPEKWSLYSGGGGGEGGELASSFWIVWIRHIRHDCLQLLKSVGKNSTFKAVREQFEIDNLLAEQENVFREFKIIL